VRTPVGCPRCHSSFHPDKGTLIDPQLAAQAFAETVRMAEPALPPVPGAGFLPQVPGYETLGFIAKGGMGFVMKARDPRLNRLVAIKMPLRALLQSDSDRDRFLREARSAAGLRHPSICTIHEVGDHGGQPHIVMDYIDGPTLRSWVKTTGPTARHLAGLVAQLAEAADYAHRHGVVHRDIKPGNVMVDGESGHPVLMDFGLAKDMAPDAPHLTCTGQVVGTPAYMSPEQASGHSHEIGPATDQYALGVLLYECLCGRLPFLGSVGEIIRQVQTEEPPPLRRLAPHVHVDLETICQKAMAKDPAARYPSCQALAEDLRRFCAGEPILARRAGAPVRLWRRARRNPVAAGALAAGVLLLLVAVRLGLNAATTRRAAGLHQVLRQQMETGGWSAAELAAVDAGLARLRRLSPEQADALAQELPLHFATAVRARLRTPSLEDADLAWVRERLALLQPRDPALGAQLAAELEQRLRTWDTLFDWQADAPPAANAFSYAVVEPAAGALVLRSLPADTTSLPPGVDPAKLAWPKQTRVSCTGNVEMELVAAQLPAHAHTVGLMFGTRDLDGYTFLLTTGEVNRNPGHSSSVLELAGPTFGEVQRARGQLSVILLRGGTVLREERVGAGRVLGTGSTAVRLLASRQAGRVSLQVNSLPPFTFDDLFPLKAAPRHTFGVFWPDGAPLRRLRAQRLALPATPLPLEAGDELYGRGEFADAMAAYQRQAATADLPAVAQEARYKTGLCLLALSRPTEACSLFQELMFEEGERFPALAACQLWAEHLRRGRQAEADAVFATIAARHRFEELAAVLPDDVRSAVSGEAVRESAGFSGLRLRPGAVERLERAVAVKEIGGSRAMQNQLRHNLICAYWCAGQPQVALATGLRILGQGSVDQALVSGDAYELLTIVEDCSWLLRIEGRVNEAQELVDRWLFVRPGECREACRRLLPERARIRAALGDWDGAERDLAEFLDAPGTVPETCGPASLYAWTSTARLLQGFLCERRGDSAGAQAAWQAGVLAERLQASGANMLNAIVLASLSGTAADARTRGFMAQACAALPPPANEMMKRSVALVFPPDFVTAVLRESWRRPRGRELARRIAYGELTYHERAALPLRLIFCEIARQGATGEDIRPALDTYLWETAGRFLSRYATGEIADGDLLFLILAWAGNAGALGWGGVASRLEPSLRADAAYMFGHRFLRLGQAEQAREFFATALRDAPPDAPVRPLAEAELARLAAAAP
jgi:tRNA A-37 threonylcarbamoyl transferase component Bud32/tetratricopeptide (TPR) repeat protein